MKGCLKLIGGLVVIGILVVVFALVMSGGEGEDVVESTAVPREAAPAYAEILANYGRMTDAQWNDYARTLQRQRAEDWEGVVSEVDEGEIVGGFTVYVDMAGESIATVYIDVEREVALALPKDTAVRFSGDISVASNALGLTLRLVNAEIEMK